MNSKINKSCIICKSPQFNDKQHDDHESQVIISMDNKQEQQWECPSCTFLNDMVNSSCTVCSAINQPIRQPSIGLYVYISYFVHSGFNEHFLLYIYIYRRTCGKRKTRINSTFIKRKWIFI